MQASVVGMKERDLAEGEELFDEAAAFAASVVFESVDVKILWRGAIGGRRSIPSQDRFDLLVVQIFRIRECDTAKFIVSSVNCV
jgi:hypothetical protein